MPIATLLINHALSCAVVLMSVLPFLVVSGTLDRSYDDDHHAAHARASAEAQSQRQPHLHDRPHGIPSAFFVFGDSLVDSGNNNYLFSMARADYYPYGMDFPLGTTGRFCNGRTVADFLAEKLDLPFIPPYLNPLTRLNVGPDGILRGVNYASGAAGILESSGRSFLARVPFHTQIQNFKQTLQEYKLVARPMGLELREYLSKSLFGIVFGSNDFLDNYFMYRDVGTENSTADLDELHSAEDFRSHVVSTFHKQLVDLYQLGARRFLISDVGPLGCIPKMLSKTKDGQCVDYVNALVLDFNQEILKLVHSMNADPRLQGAIFLYAKVYEKVSHILHSPQEYGFTETKSGCCGLGKYKGMLTCLPLISPFELCDKREKHVFWDAYHPTEAVNHILANAIFYGNSSEIVPMNLNRLISTS